MSKLFLALVIVASAAICDPPRVLAWAGPQAQAVGWKIKTALGIDRFLPNFSSTWKR
jgi:hypothetical protein